MQLSTLLEIIKNNPSSKKKLLSPFKIPVQNPSSKKKLPSLFKIPDQNHLFLMKWNQHNHKKKPFHSCYLSPHRILRKPSRLKL